MVTWWAACLDVQVGEGRRKPKRTRWGPDDAEEAGAKQKQDKSDADAAAPTAAAIPAEGSTAAVSQVQTAPQLQPEHRPETSAAAAVADLVSEQQAVVDQSAALTERFTLPDGVDPLAAVLLRWQGDRGEVVGTTGDTGPPSESASEASDAAEEAAEGAVAAVPSAAPDSTADSQPAASGAPAAQQGLPPPVTSYVQASQTLTISAFT